MALAASQTSPMSADRGYGSVEYVMKPAPRSLYPSESNIQDELSNALRHHQSGQLEQAARIYQSILDQQPDHADALHLLGVVALQQGNPPRAVELIGRAIAVNPSAAAFHCNLAEAYRALGELDRAAGCCQLALRLQPDYPEAANNLGLILQAQGKNQAAIAQFREALRLGPNAPMVHNNLGNALRLEGDKAQALACFRQAVRLGPNLAEAHSNLGQLLLELRHGEEVLPVAELARVPLGTLASSATGSIPHAARLKEAAFHCGEAVRLGPNFPDARNNLGNVLREQGKLHEAKSCYAEALRLNPDLALTYSNMGQALQEEGKLDDAIAWYQQGLKLAPAVGPASRAGPVPLGSRDLLDSVRIHCNLASALEEQEKHEEAAARYEMALRLDPGYAEAHNGLGFVLHEQGQFEEAKARYREAIRLQPDLASAHGNLGTVLEELNEFDAAQRCFREALRHDPNHAGAYAQLATMLRGKLPEADLAAMRQLLADPQLAEGKRSALHFGLGQVLDAQGVYDEAAEHLCHANALCQADWQKRGKGYNPAEHTRFVDELIAAFTPEYFARVPGFGLETERPIFIVGLPRSGTTLIEQVLASHSQVFGAGELRYVRDTFEALPQALNREATPVECLPWLDRATCGQVAQRHLDRLRALNEPAPRITDKLPDNYLYLGLIATLFPRAKLIHCRRDLRDVAVSCWITHFRQIRWASAQESIASRFHEYQRLMEHWRKVLPAPLLEVDYEETVDDLETVARRLVAWCGLEWEPGCLAFHENRRPVRTASVTQVRQPIYKKSVARWKNYEKALAPLFAQL
jgi:tetratricopeptide (TPR) repeat protein